MDRFMSLGLLFLVLLPALCNASTQCPSGNATDTQITQTLTIINERRTMLAAGTQSNGNSTTEKLPKAKSMMELSWNCTLEETAKSLFTGKCDHAGVAAPAGSALITFSDYAYNFGGASSLDLTNIFSSLLKDIDHETLTIGTNAVSFSKATGPNLQSYVDFVRASTTSIGCAVEQCGLEDPDTSNFTIYCVTDQPGLQDGETVYEVTTTTCDCPAGTTCNTTSNLCIPAASSSSSSSSSSVASSASASTTPAGATTGPAGGGAGFPVPMQGESTMCNSSHLTDSLRIQFLDTHNVRRTQLALGNLKDAGPNKATALPAATNMYQLIWDCDLEAQAHNHLSTCPTAAAATTSTNATAQVGENFHRVSSSGLQYYRDGVKNAVVSWWKVYRTNNVPNTVYQATHAAAASYTQMGWALTRRIGCSIGNCSGTYVIDCRYSPKGNTIGSQQYIPGTTCSACPGGTACSPALGLCA